MLRRIRVHNYLNGHVFSFAEYVLVAAVLTPFLIYYVAHGRTVYAVVAIAIILNCFAVATPALISILKGEQSIGLLNWSRDRELRRKIGLEHPSLARDTAILSITVLIPFWIIGAVLLEAVTARAGS